MSSTESSQSSPPLFAACALPGSPLDRARAGLDACVHCGFCLEACPTYVNLEDENDSPRGRIVLMRRMLEGEIPLTDPIALHMDRCLGCRACETACPSGVPYGELIEATRATMAPVRGIPFLARSILFVFSHHPLLRATLALARMFRATGLPKLLARALPKRLALPMAMLASSRPSKIIVQARKHRGTQARQTEIRASNLVATHSPQNCSTRRSSTAILEGCVMSGLFAHVNIATLEALEYNGHQICGAAGQRCCGALHAHAGDLAGARALARENIAAFERSGADTIVVNAAGCGAMLKEYGRPLADDPLWAERAEALAVRTRDVSEALAESGPRQGTLRGPWSTPPRVTHDAPCHQMHAQRITQAPLDVLGAVSGIDLVPLVDADQCCGSAGIYNLIEPDTSDAVLEPKLRHIINTGATVLASGNPGCLMQMGAGLMLAGQELNVLHPVELLAASYPATSAVQTLSLEVNTNTAAATDTAPAPQ